MELVRIDLEESDETIEQIRGTPVFRLRGQLLSLIDLGEVLDLPAPEEAPEEVNIVVLQADDRQFGLLVDTIHDTEEIVVKPLGREIKGIEVYAGATIMGDGRVALILDVAGLANRGHIKDAVQDLANAVADARGSIAHGATDAEMLLVFRAAGGGRMALPLAAVARLEEFPAKRIESVGNRHVIQYRGEILPLVDLSQVFGGPPSMGEQVQVVVHANDGRNVGFIVDRIEDVVQHDEEATGPSSRHGVVSTAVIGGQVTELLDAEVMHSMVGAV